MPELSKNPKYLAKHHLEVIDSRGQPIAASISEAELLKRLAAGTLALRQPPGPENSLGLVKFAFPNRYSVYLHGTPEKHLFSKFQRDLSHGCIRLEDPVALAAWVLREDPAWNLNRIKIAMRGARSIQVNLRHPIPVLIVYGTAFVEEDGEVRFFRDIYGHDAVLEQALFEHSRR